MGLGGQHRGRAEVTTVSSFKRHQCEEGPWSRQRVKVRCPDCEKGQAREEELKGRSRAE